MASDAENNTASTEDLLRKLISVVADLRGPEGCPWDKAQTHQSLSPYTIEEAFELVDAIESRSDANTKEELGDVLFQVILHSQLAKERGSFQLNDVIAGITEKLIKRHPHVFSDLKLTTADEVKRNWDAIKASEKKEKSGQDASPFASIPKGLPALQRSQKIGHRTIRFNFDWNDVKFVFDKIEEELAEVKEALRDNHGKRALTLEIGDLLFTVTQLARHLDIDAEQALRLTNKKFETRFLRMLELVKDDKKDFATLPITELELYWQKAKRSLQ